MLYTTKLFKKSSFLYKHWQTITNNMSAAEGSVSVQQLNSEQAALYQLHYDQHQDLGQHLGHEDSPIMGQNSCQSHGNAGSNPATGSLMSPSGSGDNGSSAKDAKRNAHGKI